MLRPYVDRTLKAMGLELRRHAKVLLQFPVEFTDEERRLISRILERQLSMASPERLFSTLLACKHVVARSIPGDFVECGVWRGGNALLAASAFRQCPIRRQLYLFDTFEGMTPPSNHDTDLLTNAAAYTKHQEMQQETHNAWCYASLEDVQQVFQQSGHGDDEIVYVKGDVAQTLREERNLPERISVLRLDTDWYESTLAELEVLYPRLVTGGVLIVDDYGHWAGAKKAVDEYFMRVGKRPLMQYVDYTGRMCVKED